MKKSFTLIELMVVIGLVVLLTAASVAGISASRNRRQVKTTAEKVKSFLMEARSRAMNPDDTSFGVTGIGVRVYPSTSSDVSKIKTFKIVSGIPNSEVSEFKFSKGIDVGPGDNSSGVSSINNKGNMKCDPINCINPVFYFFTFEANSAATLGQIKDSGTDSDGNKTPIFITVTDGSQTYTLKMNNITGIITIK